MIVTSIDRLPVMVRPGFDCRGSNATCPGCEYLRQEGRPPDDHGVSGGMVQYGVAADIAGRRFALTLEVLAHDYPETARAGIAASRPILATGPMSDWFDAPRGAGFYLHERLDAPVAESDEGFVHTHATCEWFDGAPCKCETLTWIGADEFYRAFGFKGDATVEELKTRQDERFWLQLGAKLVAYAGDR